MIKLSFLRVPLLFRPITHIGQVKRVSQHVGASKIAHEATAAGGSTSSEEITLTESCVNRLVQLQKSQANNVPLRLRVLVDGGGCSGFQYKFSLVEGDEKIAEEDRIFAQNGAEVVVDSLSLSFLAGAKVDYVDEMIKSSFVVVDNPLSSMGCSCGASFAPK